MATRWGDSGAARDLGIATYPSTPIQNPGGRLYGTLCAASDVSKPATDDASRVLRMCSQLIGQQVEREWLMQELRAANHALAMGALTDPLTLLPNRRALMEELPRSIARRDREHSALLVAFIDLDGFKAINDAHGHEAGDNMLSLIGHALSTTSRAEDYCARLGGDEFVVLASVPAAEGESALAALRDRLHKATRGHFDLGGGIAIDYDGPSIGAIVVPVEQHEVDAVLALADAAMYAVKRQRRQQRPR